MEHPNIVWVVDNEHNIHFTLTSNGFTPQLWEQHFKSKGSYLSPDIRDALSRANELPTCGVAYNIVVCKATKWNDNDRTTGTIRSYAIEKRWVEPHWEVALLIHDSIVSNQLGAVKENLWYIVTMHKSVKDSKGFQILLSSYWTPSGVRLDYYHRARMTPWNCHGGFAFVVPNEV